MFVIVLFLFFFFFNDTATTEIYTLSLHDALPITSCGPRSVCARKRSTSGWEARSEEHTSELQSRGHLVCRLLLEKKKKPRISLTGLNKKKNNSGLTKSNSKK